MEKNNLYINDIDDENEDLNLILQLIFSSQYPKVEIKKPDLIEDKKENKIQEIETSFLSKKKLRCFVCRKRIGLDYFTCNCSQNVYCSTHRYPFEHNCSIEYKKEFQDQLRNLNPVVIKDKLERI